MRLALVPRCTATTALAAALIASVCAAQIVRAKDIYKSVDAQGHVVYSDQPDPSVQQSVVEMAADSPLPPRTIHFCWTNCFTLVLHERTYVRADGTDETWTVDRFTANSVRLRRHDAPADWNGYSKDVAYEGDVANDRLINITVNGKATSGIDAAWGAALSTLPGSNEERDHAAGDPQVSTSQAPPPLPTQDQPMNSQDGALWTPGYWSWDAQRYHWVRGAWVRPPQVGLLWTPAYWGFVGGYYVFHPGYWAPQVGYYGGVNYGFGYNGAGYIGGRWVGNSFAYNSAVNNVNTGVVQHAYTETASSRLPAPTPSANPPAASTHRPVAPTPKLAAATDTFAPAAETRSQRASVSSPVSSQGTPKQTGTPKSLAPKPTKLQQ